MLTLPGKPEGSVIEEEGTEDGFTLYWKPPSAGMARFGAAAFLGFWLCGWAVGEVAVITILISGILNLQGIPGGGEIFTGVFLLVWLGGWTVGGIFAMGAFWNLIRPPQPESVSLGINTFRYQPGSSAWLVYANQDQKQHSGDVSAFSRRKKPVKLDKTEIKEFKLDYAGERQRLTFDHGAERIEIGASLREPEREWLHQILEAWWTA